ncbi:PBP1A family penicillin-binding protein [Phenylobacterium sp. LjRoot225]|uniref:transglycosylase domain-containing protein n=1 Tax=Phenylobacterium sp. LjRoot225 TaxID=3342285 RepID=UPI003ECC75AD
MDDAGGPQPYAYGYDGVDPHLPHDEPPARPRRPRFWTLRRILGVLTILAVLFGLLVAWLSWSLPVSRALEPLPTPALVLVSADGHPFARRGAVKDRPVDVAALPPHVAQAFVAIEDRRFYRHFGVDVLGVGRALVTNIKERRIVEGGSTLTQQLAKTAFLSSERTFRRKAQEVVVALWLEARLTKAEILSRYLSSVYFGDGVFGLRAAAQHYFAKPPEQLTVGEAAMLAGLVKAPSALNPVDHPQAAAKRQRVVLGAMVETKAITQVQAQRARRVRIRATEPLPVGGYFADWAAPQVKQALDAQYGRIEVRTTLDSRLQRRAERAVRSWLDGPGKRQGATQAALVALRPDGAVVAMVGGRDYAVSQFNRAVQAKRQPGSAFKLFVYLAALRDGARPDSLVSEAPITVGGWTPRNYERTSGGDLTLREAFSESSNIAAVRLAQTLGRDKIVEAAQDFGVTSPLVKDATLPLGTSEMTLLELTSAYAAVAAGDAPVRPYALLEGQDRLSAPRALPPQERVELLDLLGATVEGGTARAARLDQPVFGKTGTTQEHRDAVFVGFTGDIIVGVWVGNDDHSPMRGVTGGGLPAQIWRSFTVSALDAGLVERVRPPPPPSPMPEPEERGIGGFLHRAWESLFGG